MLDLVNLQMCTSNCPCDPAAYSQGYSNMNPNNFTFNGRSNQQGSGNGPNGKLKITLASGAQTAYSDFQTCYMAVLKDNYPKDQQNQHMAYFQFMKPMEQRNKCSAFCVPGLFYFTQQISSYPKAGCVNNILNEAGTGYTVPGTIAIVSSIVMFLIFLFQYCLWCDKKDDQWGN